eukprot:scaffold260_cov274-Pinguiococcus_pyrenoidosus.AAC.15
MRAVRAEAGVAPARSPRTRGCSPRTCQCSSSPPGSAPRHPLGQRYSRLPERDIAPRRGRCTPSRESRRPSPPAPPTQACSPRSCAPPTSQNSELACGLPPPTSFPAHGPRADREA